MTTWDANTIAGRAVKAAHQRRSEEEAQREQARREREEREREEMLSATSHLVTHLCSIFETEPGDWVIRGWGVDSRRSNRVWAVFANADAQTSDQEVSLFATTEEGPRDDLYVVTNVNEARPDTKGHVRIQNLADLGDYILDQEREMGREEASEMAKADALLGGAEGCRS